MSQPADPSSRMDLYEIPVPDVSGLVTENDEPVDNVFSEKQMRLLTEPMYASWHPPEERTFFLAANVAVFPKPSNDPLVPDVFLSLDTTPKRPFLVKQNRSYFVWEHGKPPDVVIEIVSNTEGEELTRKLRGYERMRVGHYLVFDPDHQLSKVTLSRFELHIDTLVAAEGPFRLDKVDVGLTLWTGTFEGETTEWLRWCDAHGQVIPTGAERADRAEQRADTAEQRAERLAARLRELGIDPDAM